MTSTDATGERSELSQRHSDAGNDDPTGVSSTPSGPAGTVSPPTRRTRQRDLIAAVLDATDQWLTAQQVYGRLATQGQTVGLATVYRTLTALASGGDVDVQRLGDEWAYRRCSESHHHHLTCRACGATVEVEAPGLEAWAHDVADAHGYSDIDHVVEITGTCPACQSRA